MTTTSVPYPGGAAPSLEAALAEARPPLHLTPCTTDRAVAAEWFDAFEGAGLDGVVAKPEHLPYRENERVMLKVKHERTADCVVAGFRWHKSGAVIGSLLLGLYDDAGTLHHVGVAAAFPMAQRKALVDDAGAVPEERPRGSPVGGTGPRRWPQAGGRMPGGQSRWNAGKDRRGSRSGPSWWSRSRYDHLQGDRFRHAAKFVRFRDDRKPTSCTYAQFEEATRRSWRQIFGLSPGR